MAGTAVTKALAAGALLLAAAAAAASPVTAHKGCHGKATYQVTFHFNWSSRTHPRSYPSDGHFSPATVASHSAAYQMWRSGSFASPGMVEVAETGNPAALRKELGVYEKAGHVGASAGAEGPTEDGTTKVTLRVQVGDRTPYLSGASMAAPSPDWFTGFHGLNMCNRGGAWRKWRAGPLVLYDAGSDSGALHLSGDKATMPPTTISSLRFGYPSFGRNFGWFSVRRVYEETYKSA